MKASSQLVAFLALTAFTWCRAGEEQLRPAITKGLGFLAKAGEQWMEDKNCNGCHHLPTMIWSHREAKLRGFAIDQTKFDEWLAWSGSRVKDVKPGLEQVALMTLAQPDKVPAEAEKLILAGQQPDGAWKPAGQYAGMQRRSKEEAQFNSTRLFLLALASSESGKKIAEDTRVKVAALKGFNEPPKSVETLAFRALYAKRFGTKEDVEVLLAELLKLQREDGGWSWMTGDAESDALGTGEVLYVLRQFDAPKAREAADRAQQWLIHTQGEDGSWPVKITMFSNNPRTAPGKEKSLKDATGIYIYWAGSWATLGLLQGVPVVEAKAGQ
ncbi:MAG: prenyltransferase/squalene oxidase repeat-containing protein [Verrucomicrobiaceae bacterium]